MMSRLNFLVRSFSCSAFTPGNSLASKEHPTISEFRQENRWGLLTIDCTWAQSSINKSSIISYPGRDLNPYDLLRSQDFKSCVSTNSTTRAGTKNKPRSGGEGFLSGKRDSNSRPRPWQGRALPTELLPLFWPFFIERTAKLNLNTKSANC